MKEAKYRAVYCCVGCRKALSRQQRMYSSGVCPHCGYSEEGEPTIVPCERQVVRVVPWWRRALSRRLSGWSMTQKEPPKA